jgi:hypothetical protein
MPMTTEKLRSAILACDTIIVRQEGGITMAIQDVFADTPVRRFSHLLWMSRTGLQHLEDGKVEAATRWLGFLQGALWQANLLTQDQITDMNSDDPEVDAEKA